MVIYVIPSAFHIVSLPTSLKDRLYYSYGITHFILGRIVRVSSNRRMYLVINMFRFANSTALHKLFCIRFVGQEIKV